MTRNDVAGFVQDDVEVVKRYNLRQPLGKVPEQIFQLFPALSSVLDRKGGFLSGGQQQQPGGDGAGQQRDGVDRHRDDDVDRVEDLRAEQAVVARPASRRIGDAEMVGVIPTDVEIHDNIVAFWNPGAPATAGSEDDLSYRLSWVRDTTRTPPSPAARRPRTREPDCES